MAPPTLSFTVRRQEAELVAPAKPTPRELKPLSDIDDQDGLRISVPVIHFYRNVPSMEGKDPAKVIKEALAQALVFYYPVAGRLREGQGRKLSVDCTGEGVMFTAADADVSIEDFGDMLHPPFPCLGELFPDPPPGSGGLLNCPIMHIQVTRFKCGGFVLAHRTSHTMMDAPGKVQFLGGVSEMARGARAPSILPVWKRDFFNARDPPRVTCAHREYDETTDTVVPFADAVYRHFFFTRSKVSALRRFLPDHLRQCTTFELLLACLWRCRTMALETPPEEEVRVSFVVNARGRKFNPPVPEGYYGNAIALPVALTTAGELCRNPLGYGLELLRKTKSEVTQEYMQSQADLMVIRGRPDLMIARTFSVSDLTRVGFGDVDFGWGKAAYAGPVDGGSEEMPGVCNYFIPLRNQNGEDGIVVPLCLPGVAMERFQKEINAMFSNAMSLSLLCRL